VAGVPDPDVATPEAVIGDAPGEVADDLPALRRDAAARPLGRPVALDLAARIDELRQKRFGSPVPGVPLG
jgi:hypothetical protein